MDKSQAWALSSGLSTLDPGREHRCLRVSPELPTAPSDQGGAPSADGEYRASLRLFRYPARYRSPGSRLPVRAASRTTRVLRWITRVVG